MKKRLFYSLLLIGVVAMLSGCHKAELGIKQKIRKAELGTVQYTVRQIIRNSDETWQILGDKKVLFSVKATLKAGINLDKMTDDDIIVNGKNITLILPKADLLAVNIQPRDIRVAYTKVSALRKNYTQKEYDQIMRAGETAIKADQSLRAAILADAQAGAQEFFELLLRSNGYNNIEIRFK